MTIITQEREVQDFSTVELRGSGSLMVEQNPEPGLPEKLVVEADDSLIERLTSKVVDGKLILSWETPGWNLVGWIEWMVMPKTARFRVTMNQVNSLVINGSGTVDAANIRSDNLSILISGSGKINLPDVDCKTLSSTISGSGEMNYSGKVVENSIRISGSGKVRAADLQTEQTKVNISGSGNIEVAAEKALDVRISGSGSVRYRGQPKVSQSISGSGSVREME
jgi:carbon monoxide dehydrogenase subunit G